MLLRACCVSSTMWRIHVRRLTAMMPVQQARSGDCKVGKLPQGHQLRSSPMTWSTRTAPAIVLAAAFAALLPTPPVRADVVTDWNARAETIAIEKQITPAYNARQMAIQQVAVFEAVNAIERRYAPYRLTLTAERTLSKDAAAAAAAHAALVAFHPERQEALDAAVPGVVAPLPR